MGVAVGDTAGIGVAVGDVRGVGCTCAEMPENEAIRIAKTSTGLKDIFE